MDGIRIYRGINQIGGIVTELRKGEHRILIDLGANLPGTEHAEAGDEELLKTVFSPGHPRTDAVMFTHYHGDHVGLRNRIAPDIPLYAGRTSIEIMKLIAKGADYIRIRNGKADECELPATERMMPYYWTGKFRYFNGIRIMPLVCDHSALDAYMFLIEMNGKRILYTGDFRAHGVPGEKAFEKMIRSKVGKIDILVTEGTMISRAKEEDRPVCSEADLRKRAAQIFAEHKENVVLVSSTNLDSVMSFYHAVPDDKVFLCDPYQARVMKIAIDARRKYFSNVYRYRKQIYVLCPEEKESYMQDLKNFVIPHTDRRPFRMADPEIWSGKGFVMLARPNRDSARSPGKFEALTAGMKDPHFVYSMWTGYLKGGKAEDPAIVRFLDGHTDDEHMEVLHTSGHAYLKDLKKLMDLTQASCIIPMHTESAKLFQNAGIFSEYRDRILTLKPGELLPL